MKNGGIRDFFKPLKEKNSIGENGPLGVKNSPMKEVSYADFMSELSEDSKELPEKIPEAKLELTGKSETPTSRSKKRPDYRERPEIPEEDDEVIPLTPRRRKRPPPVIDSHNQQENPAKRRSSRIKKIEDNREPLPVNEESESDDEKEPVRDQKKSSPQGLKVKKPAKKIKPEVKKKKFKKKEAKKPVRESRDRSGYVF
jgi:hypothetical protein